MEIITNLLGPGIFGQILVAGLVAATGLITYVVRSITKNQKDLIMVHNSLKLLVKEVESLKKDMSNARDVIKKYEGSQRDAHEQIAVDLERLRTIVEIAVKPWDGEERRSNRSS